MSYIRQKRLPINCQPCRQRKIRCPRDGIPCGTCKRRGIPMEECAFAQRPRAQQVTRPQEPISPISSSHVSSSVVEETLSARLSRIEDMLAAQQQHSSSVQQNSGGEWFDLDTRTSSAGGSVATQPEKTFGTLQTTSLGHVRFIPCWPNAEAEKSELDGSEKELCPFGTQHGSGGLRVCDVFAMLPPTSICTRLKDIYFASFAPLFHLLHDPSFHSQYARFENDPESMPLAWMALLFAMISTAMSACDASCDFLNDLSRRPTLSAKIRDLTERYRAAAMRCLEMDNYMWSHNLTTLQALIILIYGINHSHGQSWTLLGLTYHMALSLGCHVDPSSFNLNLVESEERRRCWACIIMLCTLQNTSMRNLAPHYNSCHYAVWMPADVDDSNLTLESTTLPINTGRATQMSYLLLKFRLYDIGSKICSQVLNSTSPDINVVNELDKALMQERHLWSSVYHFQSRQTPLSTHHKIHLKILHSFSHQLALLLYRPMLMHISESQDIYGQARSKSIESARALLEIHASFHSDATFKPFTWYDRGLGCFHSFHAAVVLFALSLDVVSVEQEPVVDLCLLRECVQRFEKMSDLSLFAQRTTPILHRLLTSLELQRNSPAASGDLERSLMRSIGGKETTTDEVYPGHVNEFLDHLDPQQWLTPSAIPWDQWDAASFEGYSTGLYVA